MDAVTVRNWVREREIRGKTMFSLEEVRYAFPGVAHQVLLNALSRLKREKVLYSPYSSFYVILPPQYVLRGAVPPYYFIGEFMKRQKRPYYFGLLSAAAMWGAAHQRAQTDFVVTVRPRLSLSETSKRNIRWIYRNAIPTDFLCEKNGETGPIVYSNAELTALDLIRFEHYAGGLSAVASVIAELLETTDFSNAADGVFGCCNSATIQRLGYIVENVLQDERQGAAIFGEWQKRFKERRVAALSPRVAAMGECDDRWKVVVNARVEADDI